MKNPKNRARLFILATAIVAAVSFSVVATHGGNSPSAGGSTTHGETRYPQTAADAISEDTGKSGDAIARLRQAGQPGLASFMDTHRDLVKKALTGAHTPELDRLRAAADKIAMQKDALSSGLYWYTDLDAAQAEAARTNKPILSLRMLGNLNEDLSCANSRYFRTTLYANAAVSDFLRKNFILHWESVRPVPVITIDMGDGRKIVRTITGNSIHYILDSKGRVIDGIPGLYGAQAFLHLLTTDVNLAAQSASLSDKQLVPWLKTEATNAQKLENDEWLADFKKVGGNDKVAMQALQLQMQINALKAPTAVAAMPVSVSKSVVERPMLSQLMPDAMAMNVAANQALAGATTDEIWQKIADLHRGDATLDAGVIQLITIKTPTAAAAAVTTTSKMKLEDPLLLTVRNLENSIALDTVKNEYMLHAKIHEWIGACSTPLDLKAFNDRVYADLFLTPGSDPWLGLVPADTFSALDNAGLCPAPK